MGHHGRAAYVTDIDCPQSWGWMSEIQEGQGWFLKASALGVPTVPSALVLAWPSLCVLGGVVPSDKDASPVGSGPTLMTSTNLHHLQIQPPGLQHENVGTHFSP